mmetsp:Transcript_5316/g.5472  ORF Transcript_5316/g.5472 Transcript_5316/m.5472 type:complete len:668 (+) Transcript_5316:256-2259(+)
MQIHFGKHHFKLNVGEDDYVLDIKHKIHEEISDILPQHMKLIVRGKLLSDNEVISSLKDGIKSTVILLGSSEDSIESIRPPEDLPRVKNDLVKSDNGDGHTAHKRYTAREPLSQYRFMSIQTLPLPNQNIAHNMLSSIANDPGFKAVLNKNKWNVGALCELYPEGYVGVSDVCLMGLNEGKGQRILLRLRTDDLQGFRKPLSIRKILCHELAHNVYPNHDNNFYQLLRQIEKDVIELDWRTSRGHAVDSSVRIHRPEEQTSSEHRVPLPVRLGSAAKESDGGEGGHRLLPARVAAGQAAVLRLSDEEKELEKGCGCQSNIDRRAESRAESSSYVLTEYCSEVTSPSVTRKPESDHKLEPISEEPDLSGVGSDMDGHNSSTQGTETASDVQFGNELPGYTENSLSLVKESSDKTQYSHDTGMDGDTDLSHETGCTEQKQSNGQDQHSCESGEGVGQTQHMREIFASQIEGQEMELDSVQISESSSLSVSECSPPRTDETGVISWQISSTMMRVDEALVTAVTATSQSEDSGSSSVWDRLGTVREAINTLLTRSSKAGLNQHTQESLTQLMETLGLIRTIIGNAQNIPDLKYRSVNTTGKKYNRVIKSQVGAESVLIAAGFKVQNDHTLSLGSRYDMVMMYIVSSVIDIVIEDINQFLYFIINASCKEL